VNEDDDVMVTTAGHVRTLRINRPKRANALSANVSRLLVAGLLAANADPDVRVIVLTGTGERR